MVLAALLLEFMALQGVELPASCRDEGHLVAKVKALRAVDLETGLPKERYAKWLQHAAGDNASTTWERSYSSTQGYTDPPAHPRRGSAQHGPGR
jgi:hypothetical protein